MKYECRMTKEAQNPNDQATTLRALRHLIIRHLFGLGCLGFLIF